MKCIACFGYVHPDSAVFTASILKEMPDRADAWHARCLAIVRNHSLDEKQAAEAIRRVR